MDSSSRPDVRAEYEELAEDIRTTQRRMAEIRATAESDDGFISVTVGGAGELLELWLDPRIYRAPDSVALARDLTDTIHRAVERSQEQGIAIVASFLPEGATPGTTDLRFDPLLLELDRQTGGGARR
ncbi:YbaB/EbfC family nucleoid-associated protein [Amycolatopsis samaneae]|uniref:YbaB/EbfC family nucleoid-associated protein n=1 Tax=Amycolatopsis samaneae TaxID=664691 RepID=A0ABW5GUG0_9PSEU